MRTRSVDHAGEDLEALLPTSAPEPPRSTTSGDTAGTVTAGEPEPLVGQPDPLAQTPLGALRSAPLAQQVAALELLTDSIAQADPVTEQFEHSGPELGAASVRVHRVCQRLIGKRLDWLVAEEADGRWATDGLVRTYAGFVARAHGISFSRAKSLVRLARQLRDEMPEFRTALRSGRVGFEQVQILARGALTSTARVSALQDPVSEDLPGDRVEQGEPLGGDAGANTGEDACPTGGSDGQPGPGAEPCPEETADGPGACRCPGDSGECTGTCGPRSAPETVERFLLRQAVALRPEDLRRVVRYFAQVADPEADERGYKRAQEREFFQISRTLDGFHIAGFLTEEHGQQVRTALDAIMGSPPVDDTRSGAQRRAQALADMSRIVLDRGLAGSHASVHPHMGVLIGPEQFTHILNTAGRNTIAPTGCDPEAATGTDAAFGRGRSHGADPAPISGDHTDTEGDLTPPEGGWATLLSSPSATWTDGTGPVPPALLRRLASCSEVYRILFSPDGEVINHGRAHRIFTAAQRRALIARDRHCTYPGCTAPPVLCESHHARIHWADGGRTDLANGALLCFYHHDLVDSRRIAMTRMRGGWHFQLPDGRVIDTPRTPWVQRE